MIVGNFHYFLVFLMISLGLGGIFWNKDRTKKLISLGILQAAVIIFYISFGFINEASPPIMEDIHNNKENFVEKSFYHNPLPHVLMLTAIVVGMTVNALGLTLIVKIKKLENRAIEK